jgi:hypothetical protein
MGMWSGFSGLSIFEQIMALGTFSQLFLVNVTSPTFLDGFGRNLAQSQMMMVRCARDRAFPVRLTYLRFTSNSLYVIFGYYFTFFARLWTHLLTFLPCTVFLELLCPADIPVGELSSSCSRQVDSACGYSCAQGYYPRQTIVRCTWLGTWDSPVDSLCSSKCRGGPHYMLRQECISIEEVHIICYTTSVYVGEVHIICYVKRVLV